MLDVRSHSHAHRETGSTAEPAPAHRMPRWVKIFGILATVAIAIFAALHHGGGETEHLAHSGIAQHLLP